MKFLLVLLLGCLFFSGCAVGNLEVLGQDVYSLQLQGSAWNHSTLAALVVTADNESWWSPLFMNATLRAIGEWNDAIADFAANQSEFAYISGVFIQAAVSSEFQPGFDLYVNWTESSLSNTTDEIGLSRTLVGVDDTIENCSISLAVHTNHGVSLSETDMQNIALHELGHGLGLGHSNYTGDLMYSYYSVGGAGEAVSTLDVYGVTAVFGWRAGGASFYPVSGWLTENSVTLPPYITYQGLPVSPQNAPPQTLANNPVVQFFVLAFELLLHPEIAAIAVVIIAVFAVVGLFTRRRKTRAVRAGS